MRLSDIIAALEALAPTRHAEAWDNVGLLVGDPSAEVARALLTIDYTAEVADEGRRLGCELVIAYHPPIFAPLKRVTPSGAGALVYDAIRRGVALYSPHTALDVAPGGTNDMLADVVGMTDRSYLRAPPRDAVSAAGGGAVAGPGPTDSGAAAGAVSDGKPGMGRLGAIAPTGRGELFERIKRGLGVERLLIAGPEGGQVRRVAVCAGACGDLLDDALRAGVDLYLTGELRHHDALRAAAAGVTVVCALHSNSERAVLARLAGRLAAALPGLSIDRSAVDRDPFTLR